MGLAAIGIIFLIDASFDSLIDDGSLFLLLGTAVMASAWLAGTGPALAATVAGAIFGALDAPTGAVDARATPAHLAIFVVQGLLLTALVSELRRARRAAEQQAREAQAARRGSEAAGRLKDEFLATISHELRTPLNAVLGWVHLLRTGKLEAGTEKRGLESIERNVRLQAQLTGDLLDVSKVLTGELRLERRPVSFSALSRHAMADAIPVAQARGVTLQSSIPDAPIPVLGDANRLRQIVWQLLANAIKFSPRGGVVGLRVDTTADSATLTVSDKGPGINPDFLPRIFDPFTQEDPSPTRAAGGLGVGLFLVRDLVELHGGEISASNNAPDEAGPGAVFTVRLPLHSVQPERRSFSAVSGTQHSHVLNGLRVLVFDQDADGRELLRTVLQETGASVRTADSVADALEALEAWRPDVLVSDSASPDHDSYALVGKVRSLDAHRGGRIPAAALTAFGRTDREMRLILDGFQRDLPKPIEPVALTAEIAKLAGRERRAMN
jgi:signal transduction histidine kinase/CheY-like chemotaxis protein